MALVTMNCIEKVYKSKNHDVRVLDKLDFNVQAGDFITIEGPSGSGKTTLLNIIGLIDVDFVGTYMFDGLDSRRFNFARKTRFRLEKIGNIYQNHNLIDALTVEENVQFPMALLKYSQAEQQARSNRYLEKLGILPRKDHFPSELSTGECQRVAIARALAKRPRLILADEPTGDLDQRNRDIFLEMLKRVIEDEPGITTIIVSHDPKVIQMGSKKFKLEYGKLNQDG